MSNMRIIFIQLILPIATYFIGVVMGRTSAFKEAQTRYLQSEETEPGFDPEDLQHVGYSPAECGRDK